MNKNTFIGMLLMGAILIGFSVYNSKQFEKQRAYQMEQDSIAQARALEYAAEMATRADSLSVLGTQPQSKSQYAYVYKDSLLEAAYNAPAQFYTLENDKIKAVYTTRGAQAYNVEIKDYFTYDSLALNIVKEGQSDFGIQFYTTQMLDTRNFTFNTVESTDSTLKMRLPFAHDSYIEYAYYLPQGSYEVKFDFNLVNMDQYISRNARNFDVTWKLDIPRLEKGYDNERNYSTVDFKYPNDEDVENLGLRKESASKEITTKVSWFAFQQQFFSAILDAENDFEGGDLSFAFFKENDLHKNLMQCNANMQVAYTPAESVTIPFSFYFGPNHFKTLKSYGEGYEKIVPLGGWLVGWINRWVIIPIFDFFNNSIANYGIIILIMTLLLKLVISPLTIKSFVSSAKMKVIKPEIDKINAKYPKQEDAMKKQQETMDLYKKSGISMFGGCLPMLLQFPVLFAMFRFFPASFELRQQPFLWVEDLSSYDSILELPFKIPLYGDHVSLFAILVFITMFLYSKMTYAQQGDSGQMPGMKFMTLYFMPFMMLFICNNLSSALCYYYMLSNIITMLMTWVIRKFFVDEKKILAQIQKNSVKVKNKPKSKFQQRLEEAAKAQQEMLKQQQQQKRR